MTELDWTIIVSEDVTANGDHVHCHQLKTGESLNDVLEGYLSSGAVAVILINSENNYKIVHEVQSQVCLPVLVLSAEDGQLLLQALEDAEDNSVFAAVKTSSSDHVDLEPSSRAEPTSCLQPPPLSSLPSLPPYLGNILGTLASFPGLPAQRQKLGVEAWEQVHFFLHALHSDDS